MKFSSIIKALAEELIEMANQEDDGPIRIEKEGDEHEPLFYRVSLVGHKDTEIANVYTDDYSESVEINVTDESKIEVWLGEQQVVLDEHYKNMFFNTLNKEAQSYAE